MDLVQNVWNIKLERSGMYVGFQKLKSLKKESRSLHQKNFSRVAIRVVEAELMLNEALSQLRMQYFA